MRTSVGLSLQDGFDLAGIDVLQLWWRYAALGGEAGPAVLSRRVAAPSLDEHEHNLIAQALNEYFADCGLGTFPVGYHGSGQHS